MKRQPTPYTITRGALRVLAITGPACVLVTVLWATHLVFEDRPFLFLVVHLTLLAVSVGAGITAAVACCHMAVGRAFSAGMRAGSAAGGFAPEWEQGTKPLRAVK